MASGIIAAPSAPLRIAVVGVGQIGSIFAYQLARAGRHDVTVVVRPGSVRAAQLHRDGAVVNSDGERASVRVLDLLDEETPYDLVIVTLLAHQIGAVMPRLQRSAAGCIQFMFNMVEPERLQDMIGAERCSFGMPFVQAMLDSNGRLKATIGAGGQKTLMSRQRWVDVLIAAGLPAALETEMPQWLRCHAPLCMAFQSVSVAGECHGGGASWAEALVVAKGVHACFALIEARGFGLYPRSKRLIHWSPAAMFAAVLWTLSRVRSFRVLLASGKDECCALVDRMIEVGTAADRPDLLPMIAAMKPL